jgi:DNA-binding response OmpR family regulator
MSPSVLVVEDYADLRSAIASALARRDYDCDCVPNAEDAVVMLRDHKYAAILLSPTKLPLRENAVIHYLLENQPGEMPKIILMTDPGAGMETGRLRVLSKPFNHEELFEQLAAKPAL